MEKENILKVQNLTKKFGELVAVNDISFEVRKGCFFAFLGPNGAGKSTTIKILTTLLKQDSGKFYLEESNDDNFIRNNIGVVFQENILDSFLTVKENLLFRASLYIKDKNKILSRYEELKTQFDLKDIENKQFRYLSGGQMRRVEIAKALFNNPKVLFLDEPTTGLDPESRKVVWSILEDLQKQNNITIFLTTHYMEETNNADYVVIINKGSVVASGTPSELKKTYANDIFKVVPNDKTTFIEYLKKNNINYKKVSDQYVINIENDSNALTILTENKDNIKRFEFVKGTMDDVFLNVIEGGM